MSFELLLVRQRCSGAHGLLQGDSCPDVLGCRGQCSTAAHPSWHSSARAGQHIPPGLMAGRAGWPHFFSARKPELRIFSRMVNPPFSRVTFACQPAGVTQAAGRSSAAASPPQFAFTHFGQGHDALRSQGSCAASAFPGWGHCTRAWYYISSHCGR